MLLARPRIHGRRLARRLRRDDGVTLAEMIVATFAGSLVILASYSILDIAITSQVTATDRVEGVQRGRDALNTINRVLKSQTCTPEGNQPLVTARPDTLRVNGSIARFRTSYLKIDQLQIRYDSSRQTLFLDTFESTETPNADPFLPPALTFPVTATRTRVIAQNVRTEPGIPFFRYFAYTGSPPTATQELIPPPGGLPSWDRERVARIEVRFLARRGEGTKVTTSATKSERFASSTWLLAADPETVGGKLCS